MKIFATREKFSPRRSTWLVAPLLIAMAGGCGSDVPASDAGPALDAAEDVADGGDSTGSNALVVSGSRLRAVMHGPPGHKTFFHWRDTETGPCQWLSSRSGDVSYCLPRIRNVSFMDADCTEPVFAYVEAPLPSGDMIRGNGSYADETVSYRVGDASTLPSQLYRRGETNCYAITGGQFGETGLQRLEVVPLSSFVMGELSVEERTDDSLASHVMVGEDGSRLGHVAYDIANSTGCGGSPDPLNPCLPVLPRGDFLDYGELGRYADAACTVPLYHYSLGPTANVSDLASLRFGLTRTIDPVSEDWSHQVHLLGSEFSGAVYSPNQGNCEVFDTAGPASDVLYYAFGAELTLSPLSNIREGSGRYRTLTAANSAGQALVATGLFIDTEASDEPIGAFAFPDGVTRLVPTGHYAFLGIGLRYYEDSACTMPLATGGQVPGPEDYAVDFYVNETDFGRSKIRQLHTLGEEFVGAAYTQSDGDDACELSTYTGPFFRFGAVVDSNTWTRIEQEELPAL